jgi:hypothetical protein
MELLMRYPWSLPDGLPWTGRILAVPGNHDVDRTKADVFDRAVPLLAPRTEFFDASKTGKAKRDIVAPRFRAYGREAPVDVSGGWISRHEGPSLNALMSAASTWASSESTPHGCQRTTWMMFSNGAGSEI